MPGRLPPPPPLEMSKHDATLEAHAYIVSAQDDFLQSFVLSMLILVKFPISVHQISKAPESLFTTVPVTLGSFINHKYASAQSSGSASLPVGIVFST